MPKVLPRETAAPPRTARRLLALTPLACCIVGASFLGLAAIAAGVAWRHPPEASAEAAAPVPVTKTEAASAPGIDIALAAEALPEEPQSADTPDADAASAAFAVDGAVEEPPLDRVVILAPTSVPAAGRSEAAAILREAGWPAEEPRTSPFTISRTHVRYYHAADRDAAAELAALLSAEARDFTGYRPSPPAGMVELWLAGKAAPRPPAGTPPPLRQLLDHLALVLEGR